MDSFFVSYAKSTFVGVSTVVILNGRFVFVGLCALRFLVLFSLPFYATHCDTERMITNLMTTGAHEAPLSAKLMCVIRTHIFGYN